MERRETPQEFTPCTAPGLACVNPFHAHTTEEPEDNQTDKGQFLCNDCSAPAHWDEAGDYMHDDPNAPACFLIPDLGRALDVPTAADLTPGTRVYVPNRDPKGTGATKGTVMGHFVVQEGEFKGQETMVILFDTKGGDGEALNYPNQCVVLGQFDDAPEGTSVRVHGLGTFTRAANGSWVSKRYTMTSTALLALALEASTAPNVVIP